MLTVVAEMKAKVGKEAELKKELLGLLAPTRKEEGCINYDMHQSNEDPGFFVFYENWTSKEHLDKHLKTPHLEAFFAKESELLEGNVQIHLMTKCEA